ncbi:alkaline phosphatase family protein [Tsuneonella amylolytica]|uniref:alkaline phosphatase family protein n=1 Tax=Tsuneonella amylolytica TaxID=2338327 RepID=UPI000EA867FB|nr:alkaline phosphatase family protein [Tsuneonella amylolytica]
MRLSHLAPIAAALAALMASASPVAAKQKAAAPRAKAAAAAPVSPTAPRLVVAISVDQFSSDIFEQYRDHYTGGLARLTGGVVFPSGYQAHAATETCPGHSTLLTGANPARTGIIANSWLARGADGKLGDVYCAEDVGNRPEKGYTASPVHLLVPTLGERLKKVWPTSRNVAVSGKDRGALMMGGTATDAVYWRQGNGFATLAGRTMEPDAQAASDAVAALVAQGAGPFEVPAWCTSHDRAIPVGSMTVGDGKFAFQPGDGNGWVRSPRLDQATIALAEKMVDNHQLGADAVPDVLSVSLSATDYIGHSFGTNGVETCIQVAALDTMLGEFFQFLDARGTDYVVVLTADHGGLDLPERASEQGQPDAHRVGEEWTPSKLAAALTAELGIAGPIFAEGSASGDVWFDPALPAADRARVVAALHERAGRGDIAAVFTGEELAATPLPTARDPRAWSVIERVRASYMPGRSGDLVVVLQPMITPIPRPGPGYVATHGSPWDYDRRVPILFWRKGLTHFEQPLPARTVDIAPTLMAVLGLPIPADEMDGRCIDLDGGAASTCPA